MANDKKIIIIGAGLSGLSTAYHLKKDYLLLEKEPRHGGVASSAAVNNFIFDKTGHLLHFRTAYIHELLHSLRNGAGLIRHKRSSWIFSKGTYTRYPFQANTYRLPPAVIQECLVKMAEASMANPKPALSPNFKDWIVNNFGKGIARHFMFPYNRKLWRVPLEKIDVDWVERFIPRTNLQQAIRGAVSDFTKNFGYSKIFYYPEAGGIQTIADNFMRHLDAKNVHCSKAVEKINLKTKTVTLDNGDVISFDRLVSTVPMPHLARMIEDLPGVVKANLRRLKFTSVFNLNLGLNRPSIPGKHWVYFPEGKFIFYRVGFSSNFCKNAAPAGKSAIYTEVSYRHAKPGGYNDAQLIRRIIDDLKRAHILKTEDDIVAQKAYDIHYAYPLHDTMRSCLTHYVKEFINAHQCHSIGRYGSWRYMTMEDCIIEGKQTADLLNTC